MTCPVCHRPKDAKYTPFCSRRCSDVDLGRWLTGGYALPATELEQDDTSSDQGPDAAPGRPN